MTTDEPEIATQAPQSAEITAYDEAHFVFLPPAVECGHDLQRVGRVGSNLRHR